MFSVEGSSSLSGSPGAAPLQPMSPDRVNQQRENIMHSPVRSENGRDSEVHDKIRRFNDLAHTGPASMSRQLERKTADAALKRAMLGREEAEGEMRRYRDEARALRRQVEESRGRERKVGERLEDVMEKYGQAKETLQHSKTIWEKEVRHARKEVFKTQSSIVKLQEELKTVRSANKSAEEAIAREKERSKTREQEAFATRYRLAEIQEQLEKALERITFVEEERDAYKAAAKKEEIARIAMEGRLPLPPEDPDSEFASPKKSRVSLSTADIVSSASSETEIEDLTRLWQWEKQRADRTQEHLEFVQAECQLKCCSCAKARSRRSGHRASTRPERLSLVTILDPADRQILGRESEPESTTPTDPPKIDQMQAEDQAPLQRVRTQSPAEDIVPKKEPRQKKEPRRSTIFVPSEGIFRTISQQDLRATKEADEPVTTMGPPPPPVEPRSHRFHHSRTPSVDPPTFALMAQERTSLLSLLNAPHENDSHGAILNIPRRSADEDEDEDEDTPGPHSHPEPEQDDSTRPHTSAAFYQVTTTTTTVPVRDTTKIESRTPSFDANNPAMTPTMTREQALAQIKERRGRARSAAQGLATPRRQMMSVSSERRDASAPAVRAAKGRSA